MAGPLIGFDWTGNYWERDECQAALDAIPADPCAADPSACAAPHPAAVCALPAGEPDDDAALLALPHAQDFLGRLSYTWCDGCACLAEHGLCDELAQAPNFESRNPQKPQS